MGERTPKNEGFTWVLMVDHLGTQDLQDHLDTKSSYDDWSINPPLRTPQK